MSFARDERAELCELLTSVGPDAPTLCGDWTTHDLAAHLWIRETDPVAIPGIWAKPFSGLTERRMAEVKSRFDYSALVSKIAGGPARFSVFALPGVDEPANTTEFFVHHEDVRRAGDDRSGPRDLDPEVEDWMWRRLKLLGRALFRRAGVGVVLEQVPATAEPGSEPEVIRAQGGQQTVTVVGRPSELMIFAHGRTPVADVKLIGEQDAIDALLSSDLSA